jgi:hypothetical protein
MLKNRSPCPESGRPPLFRESAAPPPDVVRETRLPDRANVVLTEATVNGKPVTRFKCTIARVDIINRNGRYYPRSAYEAAIAAAQDDLAQGLLWGLLEHADDWYDPMKGNLGDIAGKFDKVEIVGDDVVGEGVIAPTAVGRDLEGLLSIGVAVGISTACTGSAKWLPARELDAGYPNGDDRIQVMQDDLRFVTIDFVSDPSNPAGRARAAERRQRHAPPPPPIPRPQEGHMHKLLKALLEKHQGKTLDQVKTEHAEEYMGVLEQIATESVQTPAPVTPTESGTVSLTDYRALEQTVVELRGQVSSLNSENHNAKRDNIASSALEAARLPSAGTVKYGETEIDLDASFRAELVQVARAAESDESARTAVDRKIVERRAALGVRESAQNPAKPRNGVNLPVTDNSRKQTDADRRGVQEGAGSHIQGIRGRAGLL